MAPRVKSSNLDNFYPFLLAKWPVGASFRAAASPGAAYTLNPRQYIQVTIQLNICLKMTEDQQKFGQ